MKKGKHGEHPEMMATNMVGKPQAKTPFGNGRKVGAGGWRRNMVRINVWIDISQGRIQWWALVNTASVIAGSWLTKGINYQRFRENPYYS
jgi:hypothetical protein